MLDRQGHPKPNGNSNEWDEEFARFGSTNAASSAAVQQVGPLATAAAVGAAGRRSRTDLKVVLVEPQIPQNAGNAARTCAATQVDMHLVEPLGFELDSKRLKRAGLDYWPFVCVDVHKSWQAFLDMFDALAEPKRLVAFSKFSATHYAVDGTYQVGDWLLFGSETHGLPKGADQQILERGGKIVKIPMDETFVRSLNLSTSVGIGLYEAIRQMDKPQPGAQLNRQCDQPPAADSQ